MENINNNPLEKVGLLIEALQNNRLPLIETADGQKARVLEIGPGGGGGLEILKQEIKQLPPNSPEVEVLTVDLISPEKISEHKGLVRSKHPEARPVVGRAQDLPFRDNSLSGINASAILHEINSYSIYGPGASSINRTLREASRVLAPGGTFCYRDVSAPLEDLKSFQSDSYGNETWLRFIKFFTAEFLNKGRKFYQNERDKVSLQQNGIAVDWETINPSVKLDINAPVGLLREIQHHYITFRKHLLQQDGFEVTVEKEQWLDENNSRKEMAVRVGPNSEILQALFKESEFKVLGENEYFIADSLDFDRAIDEGLLRAFREAETGAQKAQELLASWKDLEGGEYYCYYNLNDLLMNTVQQSMEQSGGQYALLPKSADEIAFLDRNYYQRYLNETLSHPLPEQKQVVRFWKQPRKAALQSLESIANEPDIKSKLGANGQDTLAKIKNILSKIE